MATFDDIIASVLDAENVGRRSYTPKLSRPVLPSSPPGPALDHIFPNEQYDDNVTTHQRLRRGQRIAPNRVLRDPPIPPEETNDHNVINPDKSPVQEYWDNENYKDNARFRTSRKA